MTLCSETHSGPVVEHCLLVFRADIGILEETQTPGPQPLLTFYLHREVLTFLANTAAVDGTVQDLCASHGQGMGITQTGGLMPLTAATEGAAIVAVRIMVSCSLTTRGSLRLGLSGIWDSASGSEEK